MAEQPYQYAGYSSSDELQTAVKDAVSDNETINTQSAYIIKALKEQLRREGYDV